MCTWLLTRDHKGGVLGEVWETLASGELVTPSQFTPAACSHAPGGGPEAAVGWQKQSA